MAFFSQSPGQHDVTVQYTADGIGDTSALPKMSMRRLMLRFFPRTIRDMLSGDRRRCDLFDSKSFEPLAVPRRLTAEERQALRDR